MRRFFGMGGGASKSKKQEAVAAGAAPEPAAAQLQDPEDKYEPTRADKELSKKISPTTAAQNGASGGIANAASALGESGGYRDNSEAVDVSSRQEQENSEETEEDMLENILKEKISQQQPRPRSNRSNITNNSKTSPVEDQLLPGSLTSNNNKSPLQMNSHNTPASSSTRPARFSASVEPTANRYAKGNNSSSSGRSPQASPTAASGTHAAPSPTFGGSSTSTGGGKGDLLRRAAGGNSNQDDSVALVIAGFVPQGDNQIAARKNDVVTVLDTSHAEEYGWIWCESNEGAQGWLPSSCLDLNYKQTSSPENGGINNQMVPSRRSSMNSAHSSQEEDPLAQWNEKLAETFVLHSMRNLVRLVQYVVNLLNPYGAATSLHIACWRGSIDAVEVMIEADPDLIKRLHATAGQLTPLHVATICNYPEVVQFLLDAKANCNIPTVHELSPLHLAASANSELVEILVQSRANVDAEDADGNTPLIFACCYHQVQTIEYLVEKQADARKCNRWDVSPCHLAGAYAELDGALYALQLLCSVGADPWVKDAGNLTPIQTVRRVLQAKKSKSSGVAELDPVMEFLDQFTSVTKLKPAARQAYRAEKYLHPIRTTEKDDFCHTVFRSKSCEIVMRTRRFTKINVVVPKLFFMLRSQQWFPFGFRLHNKKTACQILIFLNMMRVCVTSVLLDTSVLKKRRKEREMKEAKDQETPRANQNKRKSDAFIMEEAETPREEDEEKKQAAVKASTIAAELQQENQKLSNDNRELKRQLEKVQAELKSAETTAKANKELASQVSQQRRDQEREFQNKQNEQDKTQQQQIKKLEQQLQEKDDQWKKKLEDEKERLKKLNEEITEQLVKKSEQKSSGDVAALTVKLQTIENDLKSTKNSLTEKQSELSVAKADLSKAREDKARETRQLQSDLDSKKERIRILEAEVKELKTSLENAESELNRAKKGLHALEEYTERAERAERALKPLEQRNVQLEHMFAEEQAIRRKYHNQIQELKGAIRVYARVRPLIAKEKNDNEEQWLSKLDEFSVNLKRAERRENKEYTFDGIFDHNNTQEQVFRDCKDLIQSAVDGYNITIFAYGQTGAGKTHTMYGGEGEQAGLVPRTIKEIFTIKTKNSNRYDHLHSCITFMLFRVVHSESLLQVKVYMVEVYRDELADLLLHGKKKSPGQLEIKRDSRGTIYIENVSEMEVQSAEELQMWLDRGMEKRHTAATKMNTDSSRSHLITTILLEVYNRSKKTTALGKISLVDLAGSERLKKSEATGEQAKEAMAINKSLTALGDVIEALTSKAKHIPYRNHKLTELMSDSLGGNAKTLMFANCSPAASNAEESMGTMNYASRAKLITNNVSKQQESKELSRLKQVIATMSKEMSMNNQNLQGATIDQAGLQAALLGT
ncbi:unnamed protein product [Amoebophrya sp. A120]|nr:unnamed protein product [Amoebophrya sp. A120]|eukprot:GSA120T00024706001.1